MTPLEMLDRLAVLAEKATPGPYKVNRYEHGGGRFYVEPESRISRDLIADFYLESDRELYAALDPATVRALIACVRAGMELRSSGVSHINKHYAERQVSHAATDAFDAALAALGSKP